MQTSASLSSWILSVIFHTKITYIKLPTSVKRYGRNIKSRTFFTFFSITVLTLNFDLKVQKVNIEMPEHLWYISWRLDLTCREITVHVTHEQSWLPIKQNNQPTNKQAWTWWQYRLVEVTTNEILGKSSGSLEKLAIMNLQYIVRFY